MPLEIIIIRAGGPDDSKNSWRHRGLGDLGYGASRQMRQKMGQPAFDLVLCSNVFRTRHTAALVADRPYDPEDDQSPTVVDELFPPEWSDEEKVFVELFQNPRDQTLASYYSRPGRGGELLRETAHRAAEAIYDRLPSLGIEKLNSAKVLVVANDGIAAALVEQLLSLLHHTRQVDLDLVRKTRLGDAEGFLLEITFAVEGIGLVREVTKFEPVQFAGSS
jgi:broad specificity phosphatase PhoE